MAAEPNNPKSDLGAEIVAIVNAAFAQWRQVVLLSYLGQALRRRGFDYSEILGEQRLADFIRTELSEKIKIVPTPAGPLVLAAVPSDVDLEGEIDPFGTSRRPASAGRQEGSRAGQRELLTRGIWFAFSHALEAGKARVLRLEPDIEYEDFDASGEKPEGYDVPADLIVPVGSVPRLKRNETIYENIRVWADQHGVPFRSLMEVQTEKSIRRSALDMLLSGLSESDLARISMPLDVVAKLRRKPQ